MHQINRRGRVSYTLTSFLPSQEGLLISLNPKTVCFSVYQLLSSVSKYRSQILCNRTGFVTDFPIMFLCSFSAFNCSALSMLWSHLLYISSIFAPPTTFLTLLWERFNLFGCFSFNCSCSCEFLTYEVNQPSFNCTKTNFRSNLNESAKRKFSVITSDWEI